MGSECAPYRFQNQAQKNRQPREDEVEVVAHSGEDGVGSIAGGSLEIAAAEVALGLHVSDHGLDGGAAPQLTLARSRMAGCSPGKISPLYLTSPI